MKKIMVLMIVFVTGSLILDYAKSGKMVKSDSAVPVTNVKNR